MKKKILGDRELMEAILSKLEKQEQLLPQITSSNEILYNNKTLMEKLGVKEKYLRKLRDNGYIGFSRHGDRYWYTQQDVDRFLSRFHFDDFATGNLPQQ